MLKAKMSTVHAPCHVTSWYGMGQKQAHIWNPRPLFAYSLYNFYGTPAPVKNKGVRPNRAKIFKFPTKVGQILVVWEIWRIRDF